MPFRRLVLSILFSAAACPAFAASPQDVVRLFYEHTGAETDLALRSHFTDPALKILDDNDRLKAAGEGECLDRNMAFDNTEPSAGEMGEAVKIAEAIRGETATVVATFVTGGERHRMEWRLKLVDGEWKIADLVSGTGDWALRQYFCE
jgi:hypothetical protein